MSSGRQAALKTAAEAIQRSSRVLLACHVGPDADALGSLLGLAHGLRALGREVQAVSPDGVPQLYRFLPGWRDVRTSSSPGFDLAIGMDADGSHRLGSAEAAVLSAPCVIDLDHHTGAARYGHLQVVDPTAAATGELVFELLGELGVRIDESIACCLMAAILTDTGSFRYSNVTPATFRVAAELVAAGAAPGPIYEAVYGSRPFEAGRLLGRLLSRMERSEDGRVVWSALGAADFRAAGAGSMQTEGFVEQLRMAEGSEVAIFLREEAGGEVKVSLRSRSGLNVAQIAAGFGGGGHAAAAGCTLAGPLEEATRRVVAAVLQGLNGT